MNRNLKLNSAKLDQSSISIERLRQGFCIACIGIATILIFPQMIGAQAEKQKSERKEPQAQEKQNKKPRKFIGSNDGYKKGGLVYSTYKNAEGEELELKCDVYVPNGDGPFPTIIAVHGGAWRSGAKWHMMRHAWKFVKADFVVVAINYRHAPKYKFPAQIHDVKAAVRWMRQNHKKYKIDKEQIVAFGYSAGGHLVSLLATTDPEDGLEGTIPEAQKGISTRVKAVVAGGAPCEFSWIDEDSWSLNYWMGSTRNRAPEKWKRASPINHISKDDPPFWFFHGTRDQVVPASSTEKMNEALEKAGIETSRKEYPGYGHFSMFSNIETVDIAVEFYNKILDRKSAKPSDPSETSKR